MPLRPARPLSRARVASCILVNLAATPGLGSLIARRFWAGTGQLLLALAGFGLIVGWMFGFYYRIFLQQMDEPVPNTPIDWMWKWGSVCFGASWLWSLFTSLSLWRQTKSDKPAGQKAVPPRISDLAGPPPKLR
jgi:hypothetical protein